MAISSWPDINGYLLFYLLALLALFSSCGVAVGYGVMAGCVLMALMAGVAIISSA